MNLKFASVVLSDSCHNFVSQVNLNGVTLKLFSDVCQVVLQIFLSEVDKELIWLAALDPLVPNSNLAYVTSA